MPALTLMSVAKPRMLVSSVVTSQTDSGVPGLEFSHTTGLVGAAHGSVELAWATVGAPTPDTSAPPTRAATTAVGSTRRRIRTEREKPTQTEEIT